MDVLDLRAGRTLPPEAAAALQRAALAAREECNAAVDGVTDRLGGALEWLCAPPASRNPNVSRLPFHCAALALLQELHAAGRAPARIVTDSPAMARLLQRWLAAGRPGTVVLRRRESFLARWKRAAASALGHAAWLACVLAAARATGKRPPPPPRALVLVDTFVSRDAPLEDRYFPGLWDALDPADRERTRFVPLVYGNGFRGYRVMFRALRASGRFLLREDFLSPADCLAALLRVWRSRFLAVPRTLFRGFAIDGLIREELRRPERYPAMTTALLQPAFTAGLRRAGFAVVKTVSWYENQDVDRAWNRAFAAHYPGAARTGYQGFVPPPLYLSLFPTAGERRHDAVPDTLAVMGPALAAPAAMFCPGLRVVTAPAFRFAYLLGPAPEPDAAAARTVLVALPLHAPTAEAMLALLDRAARDIPQDVVLLVKPHPAAGAPRERPGPWRIARDKVADLLPRCALLVSTASSVCIEALAWGIPVAVAGTDGLELNPLPPDLEGERWWTCRDAAALARAITRCCAGSGPARPTREAARRFREAYLTPVTPGGAAALVRPDPD